MVVSLKRVMDCLLTGSALLLVQPVQGYSSTYRALALGWGSPDLLVEERLLLAPTEVADRIQPKIVVTERRRRGSLMDVKFRIEFEGVPQGREYVAIIWDMGMQRDGEAPTQIPGQTFKPDGDGRLTFPFEIDGFGQGEWLQLTIRSVDGKIESSARFTPLK